MNGWDEDAETIRKFVDKAKLRHTVLRSADLDGDGKEDVLGSEVAERSYAALGYPTTYWIDHTGKVVGRQSSFDPSHFPVMERRVKKLLAARAAASGAVKER